MTAPGICEGKGKQTFMEGLWGNNPISIQMLGICSALAVTNKLENSIVMGLAVIFVCAMSNLIVSLLRDCTPRRIRMIVEVAIIATFVILFDQILKAFYWDMSKQLGPYVGLIITNCIVMGRAEAFAMQNRPALSVVDGLANGVGYTAILAMIGFIRELLGTGGIKISEQLFGHAISFHVGDWYVNNQLMVLAPGAFIILGFLIALFNYLNPVEEEEDKK
ncbi:NADH:ubiquinone reductase (Na(+)-transporting) subunit D [Candidatus Hydrogenedentota bacterium]